MKPTKHYLKTALLPVLLFLSANAYPVSISTYQYFVDGILDNTEVVLKDRVPILSWEYTATGTTYVSSFTLKVSLESALPFASPIWSVGLTTNSINTQNLGDNQFRTSINYNSDGLGAALLNDSTYYWDLMLYDSTESTVTIFAIGKFVTTTSNILFTGSAYELQIDYNNPFNPTAGQITKFRYKSKNLNERVKVRIFTLSGKFVKTLAEDQLALKEREYTVVWDGKNYNEEIVPSGIYLVNLAAGDSKGITKRVIVKNK
ncbi:MAG: hypothetical protein A2252_07730 [Elusimicrobia bacterium RIFOXYA2_FULL_39_19]|nr:MAG: hypothetical protein A2252_07730 [Elusimicrobia bacterium RIFOXYA2_FULL_39_19]